MRLTNRAEWQFFRALWRASPRYAALWWTALLLTGVLPALTAVFSGWLVSAVQQDRSLVAPLTAVGITFAATVVLQPVLQAISANVGEQLAAHLYDRLMAVTTGPQGIGHLERSDLASDLAMARDFDQGMLGPPLNVSMDFLAGGLSGMIAGLASAALLFGWHWWIPPIMVAAWMCTHWLLRESGVWHDRNTPEVRAAQRHADYGYRLAVDPGPAKELRMFGLAGWATERFIAMRRHLYDLQYTATRLRERSVLLCLVIVTTANVGLLWLLAHEARNGSLSTAKVVVFAQAAIGVSAIAFGGLNWVIDGAGAPVMAIRRLEAAMPPAGELARGGSAVPAAAAPTLKFEHVEFAYPNEGRPVLDDVDLAIPAGTSMAIVGQNGAGKTTLAKLLCRFYDPTGGAITADGVPLTELDVDAWRRQVTAVFQDFVRFELPLRVNVAPHGAPDDVIRAALADAGAAALADGNLDTPLSKAYAGGTDLSGGQWQRIALARALCAVRQGATVVLLDEPTAQLDVRGEAEIFERVLAATAGCTVILISHRFSTVRWADRIAVVEHGRVVERGTHDELIAAGGRYRTMFDLQASRFSDEPELDDRGEEVHYDVLD